jgi:hypothetical protein
VSLTARDTSIERNLNNAEHESLLIHRHSLCEPRIATSSGSRCAYAVPHSGQEAGVRVDQIPLDRACSADRTLQLPEVLATKATPSGFDLDKGGMRSGLVVGVLGIVMAAVSVDDVSKPILRGRARRQAPDPIKLVGVELVHKTQRERAARKKLHTQRPNCQAWIVMQALRR